MAAAATVTIRHNLARTAYVEGKYVCDAAPADTKFDLGFVPSMFEVWNVTDKTVYSFWSTDMADDTGITIAAAVAAIASEGVTPKDGSDGLAQGVSVGTDAGFQVASKTFGFRAWR